MLSLSPLVIPVLNLAHQFTIKFTKQYYNYVKSVTWIFNSRFLLYFCKSEYRWFYRLDMMDRSDTIVTTDGSHKVTFLNELSGRTKHRILVKHLRTVVHCQAIDGKNHSLPTINLLFWNWGLIVQKVGAIFFRGGNCPVSFNCYIWTWLWSNLCLFGH